MKSAPIAKSRRVLVIDPGGTTGHWTRGTAKISIRPYHDATRDDPL